MILAIDIGNTFSKLAVFEGDTMQKHLVVEKITDATINELKQEFSIIGGIYASVKGQSEVNELLKKHNFLALDHTTNLPLTLNYKTPDTLGLDRIAAAVAGASNYDGENVLVIDMGTCVTYDFVNSKKVYLGGGISPGFEMRFKSLHQFTGKLPLVDFNKDKLTLIGDSTENSIISGVYNGLENELNGIINSYSQQYNNLNIVVTGGDANLFDLEPKNRIFADEFLVLRGLKEILNYNEKK
jgi:type III pantothenate kinase